MKELTPLSYLVGSGKRDRSRSMFEPYDEIVGFCNRIVPYLYFPTLGNYTRLGIDPIRPS